MTKKKDDAQEMQKPTAEEAKKRNKGAQEVQEPTTAPEVLELTRQAMQRDIRNLAGFADAREKPETEQEAAYYAYLVEHAQEVQDATDKEQLTFTLPEVAPELNPDSPQFDVEAYKKAIEEAGGFPVLADYLDKTLRDDYGETMQKLAAAGGQAAAAALAGSEERLKEIGDLAANAAARALAMNPKGIAAALAARHAGLQAAFEAYKETAEEAQKAFEESREHREAAAREQWPEFDDAPDHIQIFACFLVGDFEAAEAEGLDLEGLNVAQIMQEGFTSEWEPIKESPYFELIERVEDRALNAEAARRFLEEIRGKAESKTAEELQKVFAGDTDNLPIPLDRVNQFELWGFNAWKDREPAGKQLVFEAWTINESAPAKVDFVYSVDFEALDGLKLSQPFTQYDKRVYIACAGIYAAGGAITSIRQIHNAMGGEGNPAPNQRKKILESLDKMSLTQVKITNDKEVQAYKENPALFTREPPQIQYKGNLINIEMVTAIIKGKETDAVHILREPPLISFARARKEITTIKRELLESPQSKTEQVIAIQDYLIYHIKRKDGAKTKRLAYSTICDNCGITSRTSRQNAPKKIKTELQHYKNTGFIEDFNEYLANGKPAGVEIIRSPQSDEN